jgi:hypothetical protein
MPDVGQFHRFEKDFEREQMRSIRCVPVIIMTLSVFEFSSAMAANGYRLEKSFPLDPGGGFSLKSTSGSVEVRGTGVSEARIMVTSNRDDFDQIIDLRFDASPQRLEVLANRRPEAASVHNLRVHFAVEIPSDTEVELKTGGGSVQVSNLRHEADLKTSGGSITVSDMAAGLNARTSGGNIQVSRVEGACRVETSGGNIEGNELGGTLEAKTSGGSITIVGVKRDLVAHTSGGSVHVRDAGGRVEAKTSGGRVDVTFARANASGGDLETSGGGVRTALDPTVALTIDASAAGGRVVSDLPLLVRGVLSPDHIHGQLNGGGNVLRLRSDGGGTTIEAR